MKLEIKLTHQEAIKLAGERLSEAVPLALREDGLSVALDMPPARKTISPWEAVAMVRRYDYKGTGKIAAIKAIREAHEGFGLLDAKLFVESIA